MTPSHLLVLGTNNQGKVREITPLLAPYGFELRTLADYPESIDVVEDGDSFAANAILKATQQAKHLDAWVLGEDSGIVVDAIQGAPGIYSARYAGPNASDEDNNRKLLDALETVPAERRGAHYVCHMTLADPQGNVRAECEARCYGRVRREPSGSGGFGYDPLFEIREYHRTFGQMVGILKSVISHRSRANRLLIPQLVALVHDGQWI